MKLSELRAHFPDGTMNGEDFELRGLAEPGGGSSDRAEVWLEGTVRTEAPAVVDDGLTVEEAPGVVRVPDLSDRLPELLEIFRDAPPEWGRAPSARIADDFSFEEPVYVGSGAFVGTGVSAGKRVRIEPGASIRGNVQLGDGVVLRSGARIESPAEIGSGCVIHANAVIGADGFGYEQQEDGRRRKIPQVGRVVLGDNVEVGAGSCIDRATYGTTRIGSGTKIDNLVHVGHNTKIGENCVLAAFTGISGSVEIGDNVTFAGQTGVADHIRIADDVTVGGRGGVTKDITEEGRVVSGFPARSHRQQLKIQALVNRLPEIHRSLQDLRDRIPDPERE